MSATASISLPGTEDGPRVGARGWAALVVLMLPVLLVSVDNTVLSFALPEISTALSPSGVEQLWIIDVYPLVLAGLLVTMGTLGDRFGRRKMLLIGATGFALVSALAAFAPTAGLLIAAETDMVLGLLGKDATLTGRTEIWSGIMQQMADHPWRGFGYGAVWDDPGFTGPKAWIGHQAHFLPANAHSGWLEIYIALGLGGVILFALWLLQIWAQSLWAAYTSPGGWVAVPMMTSFTFTMLSESIAMNWHELRWVVMVALALKLTLGDEAPMRTAAAATGRRLRGRTG